MINPSFRFRARLLTLAVLFALGLATDSSAQGPTYIWDPNGNRSDAAGSGTWNTTVATWDNGTADVVWPNTSYYNAAFNGADSAYTVTVANGITAGSVTFNASGYTLIGASASTPGTLTVNGANSLLVAAGKTLTIGANMTLTANGTSYIDNFGAYLNGTINVNNGGKFSGQQGSSLGGFVNVGANGAINYTSLSLGSATVTVNGANATFVALGSMGVSNSTVTINQGTFGTTVGNSGLSFSNSTVNLNGGTLLYGYGAGTNTGATFNLNGGTIQTGSYPVAFNSGTNAQAFIVQAGGAKIAASSGVTISVALQHDTAGPATDGGLLKTGGGTLTLNAASTYNGGTTISGGKLAVSTDGALGTGDASVLSTSVSLTIGTGVINPFNNVLGHLTLQGGGTVGTADNGYLDLTSGANITVSSLTLGSVTFTTGVFTSALFPEYIAGSGIVTVVPEPTSLVWVALAMGLGAAGRWVCRRSKA